MLSGCEPLGPTFARQCEGTRMTVALRTRHSGSRTSGTLSRQRVDALVDQLWRFRLTLVVAPAGSGKTTALRHFVGRATPVGWCSADLLETSPDGCIAQIARVVGGAIGVELDGSSSATLAEGFLSPEADQGSRHWSHPLPAVLPVSRSP